MKNVTGQETDTSDEVNKVLNRLIDNQNQIEAKVEQMAAVNKYNKSLLEESETKKKPTKKKGDK